MIGDRQPLDGRGSYATERSTAAARAMWYGSTIAPPFRRLSTDRLQSPLSGRDRRRLAIDSTYARLAWCEEPRRRPHRDRARPSRRRRPR
jgi:hypothetical protein